jgi:hypothetical protein
MAGTKKQACRQPVGRHETGGSQVGAGRRQAGMRAQALVRQPQEADRQAGRWGQAGGCKQSCRSSQSGAFKQAYKQAHKQKSKDR